MCLVGFSFDNAKLYRMVCHVECAQGVRSGGAILPCKSCAVQSIGLASGSVVEGIGRGVPNPAVAGSSRSRRLLFTVHHFLVQHFLIQP